MTAHKFTATAEAKTVCTVCGKTRNAKAHKDARTLVDPAPAETYGTTEGQTWPPQSSRYVDNGMTEDEADAAIAEAEIAAEDDAYLLSDAQQSDAAAEAQAEHDEVDRVNAAEAAADAERQAAETPAPAAKATAARRIPADTVGSFWIGWRVAEAAMARRVDIHESPAAITLAEKVSAAKPTQLRYYRVHLTLDEIKALDAIAETFEEPGNTGYAIRASRTLRVEIAKILKAQA